MRTFGKRIQLYLMDGTPNGRWICELSNWTGIAYKIPRNYVKESENRKELNTPGIYFLFGKDEAKDRPLIYVGEAENIIARLKQHIDGKDFWNEVIVFISKDSNLNKAHIKYLENRFYAIAVECKRYTIMNSSIPAKASISEAEQSELEEFIHNAKILINTLGHKAFEPIIESAIDKDDKTLLFYINIAGLRATGMPTSDGFVLLKGSTVHKKTSQKSLSTGILKKINECNANGQVVDNITQDDISFSSSSAAADFVLGYSVSGPKTWKTKDGRTLKDVEA